MRRRVTMYWLLAIAVILYLGFFSSNNITPGELGHVALDTIIKKDSDSNEGQISSKVSPESSSLMQFAIVACFDKLTKNSPQLRQLAVLFKSMALLASNPFQINIVSPLTPIYDIIPNLTASWPEVYRKKIIFGKPRHYYYPPDLEHTLKRMTYRTCATAKLFLPHIFTDMDAIVVLDTDLLFMNQPEEIWHEFGNFEKRQILGSTPCLARYERGFKDFPAYGTSGLNTGIIMMNITRMNSFSKGWVASIRKALGYRDNFTLSDQDILTNLFSQDNSKYLYEVGCEWNYRATVCENDYNKCPAAASRGISILHGCDRSFRTEREPTIKAIFKAWEKYKLGSPIGDLLRLLQEALDQPFNIRGCRKLSNIKDIYLKGLKSFLKRKGYIE